MTDVICHTSPLQYLYQIGLFHTVLPFRELDHEHWTIGLRVHAIKRMFKRKISKDDVRYVLEQGETIETYPQDMPSPSRLVLGWRNARPLHIVAADNGNRRSDCDYDLRT